ncbi:uncharacterized protein LOC132538661 [Erinaceus europaeus]|uniref:Uncharacterized protein LOC132538661 n=1 Tax=Erinaceus europaeus TaxID=9365 RepID=A0ABM3XG99_ERIEU|nr:uncharacterized protein LOC132538661 [Erinaceus europaeus]
MEPPLIDGEACARVCLHAHARAPDHTRPQASGGPAPAPPVPGKETDAILIADCQTFPGSLRQQRPPPGTSRAGGGWGATATRGRGLHTSPRERGRRRLGAPGGPSRRPSPAPPGPRPARRLPEHLPRWSLLLSHGKCHRNAFTGVFFLVKSVEIQNQLAKEKIQKKKKTHKGRQKRCLSHTHTQTHKGGGRPGGEATTVSRGRHEGWGSVVSCGAAGVHSGTALAGDSGAARGAAGYSGDSAAARQWAGSAARLLFVYQHYLGPASRPQAPPAPPPRNGSPFRLPPSPLPPTRQPANSCPLSLGLPAKPLRPSPRFSGIIHFSPPAGAPRTRWSFGRCLLVIAIPCQPSHQQSWLSHHLERRCLPWKAGREPSPRASSFPSSGGVVLLSRGNWGPLDPGLIGAAGKVALLPSGNKSPPPPKK